MTERELLTRMSIHGGAFLAPLAAAWLRASHENADKLRSLFGHYLERFAIAPPPPDTKPLECPEWQRAFSYRDRLFTAMTFQPRWTTRLEIPAWAIRSDPTALAVSARMHPGWPPLDPEDLHAEWDADPNERAFYVLVTGPFGVESFEVMAGHDEWRSGPIAVPSWADV